jgi:hypothetical protein
MSADQAKAAGLVDKVLSFDALMGQLLGGPPEPARHASAGTHRLRLAQVRRKEAAAMIDLQTLLLLHGCTLEDLGLDRRPTR